MIEITPDQLLGPAPEQLSREPRLALLSRAARSGEAQPRPRSSQGNSFFQGNSFQPPFSSFTMTRERSSVPKGWPRWKV